MLPLFYLLWRVDLRWAGPATADFGLAQSRLAELGGALTRTDSRSAFALLPAADAAHAAASLAGACGTGVCIAGAESCGQAEEWDAYLQEEWRGPAFRPLLLRHAGRALYVGSVGEAVALPDGCLPVWLLDDGESFLLTTAHALHATTRMLLGHLAASPPLAARDGQAVVLDYGCGSAVLAIAALRLGLTSTAHAVDVYEPALAAARRNGILCGFDDSQLRLWQPYELPRAVRAHLVLANMLPGPLIAVAAEIAQRVPEGGTAVLTGFRQGGDSDAVRAAYAKYIEVPRTPSYRLTGWVALVCVRHGAPVDAQGQSEEAVR